jgi:DNA transposition AAA+ family ATPase
MNRNESNIVRLKGLIELLDLSIADIARIAGVSRPLISRILNEHLDGNGVWAELEKKLPELIAKKRKAFFEVETVSVKQVQAVVEALKKVA